MYYMGIVARVVMVQVLVCDGIVAHMVQVLCMNGCAWWCCTHNGVAHIVMVQVLAWATVVLRPW